MPAQATEQDPISKKEKENQKKHTQKKKNKKKKLKITIYLSIAKWVNKL
jgi:hypothetical protein